MGPSNLTAATSSTLSPSTNDQERPLILESGLTASLRFGIRIARKRTGWRVVRSRKRLPRRSLTRAGSPRCMSRFLWCGSACSAICGDRERYRMVRCAVVSLLTFVGILGPPYTSSFHRDFASCVLRTCKGFPYLSSARATAHALFNSSRLVPPAVRIVSGQCYASNLISWLNIMFRLNLQSTSGRLI